MRAPGPSAKFPGAPSPFDGNRGARPFPEGGIRGDHFLEGARAGLQFNVKMQKSNIGNSDEESSLSLKEGENEDA